MNTTISEQIKAIQEARSIIVKGTTAHVEYLSRIDAALNDAGSTLAALNLNPDREKLIKELEALLTEIVSLKEQALNTEGLFPVLQAIDKARIFLLANLKFDAAISGFASPDELTKVK